MNKNFYPFLLFFIADPEESFKFFHLFKILMRILPIVIDLNSNRLNDITTIGLKEIEPKPLPLHAVIPQEICIDFVQDLGVDTTQFCQCAIFANFYDRGKSLSKV